MTKEEHLLVILIEECAEVQKECSKALRFGLDNWFHGYNNNQTNRTSISLEINDLLGTIDMLIMDTKTLDKPDQRKIDHKRNKINYFLDYSSKIGKLN
jgi:hypothetical protein